MPYPPPLPPIVIERASAYDMIDFLGVNANIAYQVGGTDSADLPNRDGEKEMISALRFLGVRHLRNQGLDSNPAENQGTAYPNAPNDLQNFTTMRAAIPGLTIDYLIHAGAPTHWMDGSIQDPVPVLRQLGRMGALDGIEAPNEPNNQPTFSPAGKQYPQDVTAYNRIWSDWGSAMHAVRAAYPELSHAVLVPPTSAVMGGNYPDGVEATYERSGLTDHSALYDYMNFHSYPAAAGISLGDPLGSIAGGNPPNWGAYQVSVPNWGRYAMPGRRAVITESGASSTISGTPGLPLSERAQAIALVNDYFWAKRYGALRLYLYETGDDSTDLSDPAVPRWGLFRGDWSAKPAAVIVHRLTAALADPSQSDPSGIPAFGVAGAAPANLGACMALSKSDGSYLLACDNVLPWWDVSTGADLVPTAERWTVTLGKAATWRVIDIGTNTESAPAFGSSVPLPVRGYPMLIAVRP